MPPAACGSAGALFRDWRQSYASKRRRGEPGSSRSAHHSAAQRARRIDDLAVLHRHLVVVPRGRWLTALVIEEDRLALLMRDLVGLAEKSPDLSLGHSPAVPAS